MKLRIGLSGAAGTGKTTLAEAMSKRLGIPMVPEGVRELCSEWGLSSLKDLRDDVEKTRLFQIEVVNRKMQFEMSHDEFISDRTYMDSLAYYTYWNSRGVSNDKNDAYKKLCFTSMRLYSAVVFCPLGRIPYVEDGFRSGNHLYNAGMGAMILGFCLQSAPFFGDNLVQLEGISREEREFEVEAIADRIRLAVEKRLPWKSQE